MKIPKLGNITEVSIFQAGSESQFKWVIRQFDGLLRAGDWTVEREPTDEELKAAFGGEVKISRGYKLISEAFDDVLNRAVDGIVAYWLRKDTTRLIFDILLGMTEFGERVSMAWNGGLWACEWGFKGKLYRGEAADPRKAILICLEKAQEDHPTEGDDDAS